MSATPSSERLPPPQLRYAIPAEVFSRALPQFRRREDARDHVGPKTSADPAGVIYGMSFGTPMAKRSTLLAVTKCHRSAAANISPVQALDELQERRRLACLERTIVYGT
jgi:hypothetical protein